MAKETVKLPERLAELVGDVRLANVVNNDVFIYVSGYWKNSDSISVNRLTVASGLIGPSGAIAFLDAGNVFSVPQYIYGSGNSRLEIKLAGSQSSPPFQIYASNGTTNLFSISTLGAVTAVSYSGSGASLTNIDAGNISAGTLSNSRTTATSSNTANTIVSRDSSGNFIAGQITASTTFLGKHTMLYDAVASTKQIRLFDVDLGNDYFALYGNGNIKSAGSISGILFYGNGSGLSNLNASNLSLGTVPTARLGTGTANSSTFLRGDQTWGTVPSSSASGITTAVQFNLGGNFYGDSNFTFASGTATIAINNVTASGALSASGLVISRTGFVGDGSNITAINGSNISTGTVAVARLGTGSPSSANFLRGDGVWAGVPSGGTPAGSTSYVQYNNAGTFGAAANFAYNSTTNRLTLDNASIETKDSGGEYIFQSTPSGVSFFDRPVTAQLSSSTDIKEIFALYGLTDSNGDPADLNLDGGDLYADDVIANLFQGDGGNITGLNASNLSAGTVATARLGTGSPSSANFLRGDGVWAGVPSGVGGSANASGLTSYVQYNNAGNFAGNANFTFQPASGTIFINNISASGTISSDIAEIATYVKTPQIKNTSVPENRDAFDTFPTDQNRNDANLSVGYKFTCNIDVEVTSLGRYWGTSSNNHNIKIWLEGSSVTPVAQGTILNASSADGNGYKWVDITPVTLTAGNSYRIASTENASGDSWRDVDTIDLSDDLTLVGFAYAVDVDLYPDNHSVGSTGYSTPTFKYNVYSAAVLEINESDDDIAVVRGKLGVGTDLPNAELDVFGTILASGLIASSGFFGNGSAITNINASNISTGTLSNSRTTGTTSNTLGTLVLRSASDSSTNMAETTFAGLNGTDDPASIVAARKSAGAITHWLYGNNNGSQNFSVDINGLVRGIGSGLTAIQANNITLGTLGTARMGSNHVVDSIGFSLDGGEFNLVSGMLSVRRICEYSGTITGVTVVSAGSGFITIDILKSTYANYPSLSSICGGGTKPNINNNVKYQDNTLTSWTTSISAGDIFGFDILSASGIYGASLSLKINRT